MRVYYDFQILAWQKYGGISRYFFELYSRMGALGAEPKINCFGSVSYYFRDYVRMTSPEKYNPAVRFLRRKMYGFMNRLRALCSMRKCDILHPTYYSPYMIGHYSGKLIVTVYDMIHEKLGGELHDPVTIGNKKITIHAADHVIAISENTKQDLLEIYPDIDPEKITVIYLGNSMPELEHKGANPLGKRYVLFVGNRGWYKNFTRFAEAMRPILDAQPDLYVLCAGGGVYKPAELEALGSLSSRYVQLSLNDDALRQAYANADCFVFPSEYEGFGIPVLEAFACKCPLVCSNSSSLPEVAGDAAEYFDPLNVDEMSAKILRVLDDESLRKKLRASGRERLKLFDWDKTARETFECYKRVLEG